MYQRSLIFKISYERGALRVAICLEALLAVIILGS